jgi:hypothetical protein
MSVPQGMEGSPSAGPSSYRPWPILLQKSLCCLIDSTTDRISFGVTSSPENPSFLFEPARNHFLPSLARTSARILLQHIRPSSDLDRQVTSAILPDCRI